MLSIDISWWEVVRGLSVIVNIVLLILWIKSKVVMDDFLTGKWEGTLFSNNGHAITLECTLYVARHKDKSDTAHFYYYQQDPDSEDVISKGLDKLENYKENSWFIWNRTWDPIFRRLIHKPGNTPSESCGEKKDGLPLSYHWTCKATAVFFKPKLEVNIAEEHGRGGFAGILHKV